MSTTNVIVAGVGGQGSILIAHILGKAALRQAAKASRTVQVRIGETYGAAMRGGKVSSHVRFGDARAPLTMEDGADLVIGLEPLETLRMSIPYLAPEGTCIFNTAPYMPADVKMGRAEYPDIDGLLTGLRRLGRQVISLDATGMAQELGKSQVMSVVMLGAASATGALPLDQDILMDTIAGEVPKGTSDLNLRAFSRGRSLAENLLGTGASS